MFTSRAEYRLLLREDNADFRLMDEGFRLGLVSKESYNNFTEKRKRVEALLVRLNNFKLKPESNVLLKMKELGWPPIKNVVPLSQILKRNDVFFEHLCLFDPDLSGTDTRIVEEVETRIKYEGYINRQERQVEKLKNLEGLRLPEKINYNQVHGLTTEVREKLEKIRPVSLGQASRISGITPAALIAVQVHLKKTGSFSQ
jgi:tRNA uridine 5-carboxymethylaminomethyl modification enzyme